MTLNSYKKELENLINDRENNLIEMKNDLESLKLLATDDEINKTTISYNQKVQVLMKDIEIINNNMSLNLNNNQKILKKNIAQISQIIAEENSIELILDQNQYFISSSKIDISDKIIDILNDRVITFKLDKIK
jgi:Skp family chaperone for outer membrane proteins